MFPEVCVSFCEGHTQTSGTRSKQKNIYTDLFYSKLGKVSAGAVHHCKDYLDIHAYKNVTPVEKAIDRNCEANNTD